MKSQILIDNVSSRIFCRDSIIKDEFKKLLYNRLSNDYINLDEVIIKRLEKYYTDQPYLLYSVLTQSPILDIPPKQTNDTDYVNEKNNGIFECENCGSFNTIYEEIQTRGADESMTKFCLCNDCKNRWTIYH